MTCTGSVDAACAAYAEVARYPDSDAAELRAGLPGRWNVVLVR
jgi:hypothetical protein